MFQETAAEGARGYTVFEISSVTYIAFANYYNPQQKYSVQSTVFKWLGGHFVEPQSLQTYGAFDVKSVNINGHIFLAFACYCSGSSYNTDSFIYKWDGTKFVLFQSIPTRGALQGIHSRSAVIPTWAWPITTTAASHITLSQLCTRPLKHSSSSIKRFLDFPWSIWYDILWVQRSNLSGSSKSVQWEVQHK